jgi:hypothetical protein
VKPPVGGIHWTRIALSEPAYKNRRGRCLLDKVKPGGADSRFTWMHARAAFSSSAMEEDSSLCGVGDDHARAGHRSRFRHFQPGRRRPAAPASLSVAGRARVCCGEESRRRGRPAQPFNGPVDSMAKGGQAASGRDEEDCRAIPEAPISSRDRISHPIKAGERARPSPLSCRRRSAPTSSSAMKRVDLEHILRASKALTGETEFIIIGSQSILVPFRPRAD